MSRVGKKPIVLPEGVTLTREEDLLSFKGSMGTQSVQVPAEVSCDVADKTLTFRPKADTKKAAILWGMVRSLAQNAVEGVSKGFKTDIKMIGVGYRAALQGRTLKLQLGFSHDVLFDLPEGVDVKTKSATEFSVLGASRQKVGQVVAELQAFRKPEPYKGKGVHRLGQFVLRKEGKKK